MIFNITVQVNEDTLKERYNEAVTGEANPEPYNLIDQLTGEFGWLEQSGIRLVSLTGDPSNIPAM